MTRIDHFVFRVGQEVFSSLSNLLSVSGFIPHSRTVSRGDGTTSAFFLLSGGYLEIATSLGTPDSAAVPGNGIVALSVGSASTAHDVLFTHIPNLAPIRYDAPAEGSDTSPAWAIITLPPSSAPGCETLLVEYLRGIGREVVPRSGKNSVFALQGIEFRAETPERSAATWYETLSLISPKAVLAGTSVMLGAQLLSWQTGEKSLLRRGSFGTDDCVSKILLLAKSLEVADRMLRAGGFVVSMGEYGLCAHHPFLREISLSVTQSGSEEDFIAALHRTGEVHAGT